MPFSKHEVSLEHIEAMRVAFQKVCEALQLDCKPGEPLTDLIVMKIVEHAKAGESNPDRLCKKLLLELAEHPPGSAGK
jgi:hypothetical protein